MDYKIEEQDEFLCIKDYVIDSGDIAYYKGFSYKSEMYGCITDHEDNISHTMTNQDDFFEHFERITMFPERMASFQGVKHSSNKLPLGILIQSQFPNALQALSKVTKYGHEKYLEHDKDWLNFKRVENAFENYTNAMQRHFIQEEIEKTDTESEFEHIYHTAWNAMARLEIYLLSK